MKLRSKVMSMNMLIIVIILSVVSLIILQVVDNFNLYTVYQYLLRQSNFSQQYLSEYLRFKTNPGEELENSKSDLEYKLKDQAGCDVTITGLDVENAAPSQKSALEGNKVYLINTEEANRKLYLSFPILVKGEIIGSVTFEQSLYQADSMRESLIFYLLVLSIVAMIVSLVLSYLFSYRMIKPLEKLTETTREYSRGNFEQIAGVRTRDEIENLACSFNEMGRNIEGMIVKLKDEQEKQKGFLDNVTHEIRTPLTNILGYADLSNRVFDENQRSKYITYITGEANRLLGMVNSLLELSRLNRYNFAVEKKNTNLKTLIEQIVELMADRAKNYGLDIINELDEVTACVDAERIKQLVINLIDNCIKYSQGSRITIKLWKKGMVYIRISDDGKGIPEGDIENILEPFYRADKSRSRKLGGSGLGLSICREIVNVHSGSMKIESREKLGTTVTISLQS